MMELFPISNGWSVAYLVVEGDEAMLVDASTQEIAPQVIAKLQEVGARLRLIVLTHFHFDHVGAADAIRQATGARIAIHRADADALRRGGHLDLHATSAGAGAMVAELTRDPKPPLVPDLELADSEDLADHGGIGRSFATPGHTPGSICVLLPDGTVLVGDALTESPIGHQAAGPRYADDIAASEEAIVTIADASAGDVRVAHGGLLDRHSVDVLGARSRQAASA
jgi:glyoxylase-like metal-dependent hydrolase (beta-lactamase superfamily II)